MPYISEWELECNRCHSVVESDPEVSEYWCKCDSWIQFYRHDTYDFDAPLIENPFPKTWGYKQYKVAIPEPEIPFE